MMYTGKDLESAVAASGSSNSSWLRLESGQVAHVAVLGDPVGRELVWEGEGAGKKSVAFDPKVHSGQRPTLKIAVPVCNLDAPEGDDSQIWEMSVKTFKAYSGLLGRFPRTKWSYEVRREGTGMQTVYYVQPGEELKGQVLARVQECEPRDIHAIWSGKQEEPAPEPSAGPDLVPTATAREWHAWREKLPRIRPT